MQNCPTSQFLTFFLVSLVHIEVSCTTLSSKSLHRCMELSGQLKTTLKSICLWVKIIAECKYLVSVEQFVDRLQKEIKSVPCLPDIIESDNSFDMQKIRKHPSANTLRTNKQDHKHQQIVQTNCVQPLDLNIVGALCGAYYWNWYVHHSSWWLQSRICLHNSRHKRQILINHKALSDY